MSVTRVNWMRESCLLKEREEKGRQEGGREEGV